MIKKEIDEKLNYCETIQLIKTATKAEIIKNAPDNDENILVYINIKGEEKLCSVPISEAGQDLSEDLQSQIILKEEVEKRGFNATYFNEYSFEPPLQEDIDRFEESFDYEEDLQF